MDRWMDGWTQAGVEHSSSDSDDRVGRAGGFSLGGDFITILETENDQQYAFPVPWRWAMHSWVYKRNLLLALLSLHFESHI
jgi:hypothetical protein